MSRHRARVVLHTRAGCGLCVRAESLVAREARRAEFVVIDVDTDPRLAERYGVRVPVVTVDGEEIAAFEIAPGAVRRALRRARRRPTLGPRADPA